MDVKRSNCFMNYSALSYELVFITVNKNDLCLHEVLKKVIDKQLIDFVYNAIQFRYKMFLRSIRDMALCPHPKC